MVISPESWQVFLLSYRTETGSDPLAVLQQIPLTGGRLRQPIPVGGELPSRLDPATSLFRLSGDALGLILPGSLDKRYRAFIRRYDLARRTVETLAEFDDRIYNAAWSPDGRWVVFSAKSGLWALDIEAARRGEAAPTWLSPQPILDPDWTDNR